MTRQLRHFLMGPWADKTLFARAYLGLGLAWLLIHTVPFRWLSTHLGKLMSESSTTLPPEQTRTVRRVAWAVHRASGLTPWPSACLAQAITAKLLLRRYGIVSTLYLGAAFTEQRSLQAHAWLRCGAIYVTGGQGGSRLSGGGVVFGDRGRVGKYLTMHYVLR